MIVIIKRFLKMESKCKVNLNYCDSVNRILTPAAVFAVGKEVEIKGLLIVLSKNNLTLNRSFTT